MAITGAALDTGTVDAVGGTTVASASVSPTAESLVLFCIYARNQDAAADPGNPTSVVGGGSQTYDLVNGVLFDTRKRKSVYRARQASWTAGAITATYAGNVIGVVEVVEFAGIDTGGTNGSSAIVQSVTGTTAGATSLTVALAAFGSANNASFGSFSHAAAEATTPGASFTELTDITGPSGTGSETEWQLADADASASWATSSAAAGIGIEIKAAAAGTTTRRYSLPLTGVG